MSSFWDTFASIYDLNETVFNRSVNEQMCKALENEIPKDAIVLDCAAGTGMLSMAAAKNAKKVLCTDISKDGAMKGANLPLYKDLSKKYTMNFIASGGVSSLDDVKALAEMKLYGAIIGKAYYTGAVDLTEAIRIGSENE